LRIDLSQDGMVNQLILLNRLNNQTIWINPHLIETVEATPDTVITLINGKKWLVSDSVAEVIAKIVAYRQLIGGVHNQNSDNEASP
jgi:flagellar protein FlbD